MVSAASVSVPMLAPTDLDPSQPSAGSDPPRPFPVAPSCGVNSFCARHSLGVVHVATCTVSVQKPYSMNAPGQPVFFDSTS